jgi:hypothetical protein
VKSRTATEPGLDGGGWPFDPVAPATLWTDDNEPLVELHKLRTLGEDLGIFESYNLDGGPHRPVARIACTPGGTWGNTTRQRTRTSNGEGAPFERSGNWDHTHCLLTWATSNDGEPGYEAVPGGGLITVESYEKYIRDDVLRLRSPGDH